MSDVVPEGWKTYCLNEYSTSRRGTTYISSELSEDKERFPLYINMKSFKVNGGYNKDGDKFFSSKYSPKQLVKHNDILIANTDITDNCDILGAPIYIPQEKLKNDILFSHHVSALNISQNIDILFLYYIFCSQKMRIEMKRIGRGTTVKMLDMKDVEKISLSFPPLPEQKKIASILTSVDEVIENTQRQIDKLQDLKKATMNELLTKGIGHTEFKDSELDQIPKSWEILGLGLIAKLIDPHPSHRAPKEVKDGMPFIGIGDIDESGELLISNPRRVSKHIYDEHRKRYQITSNTIAIGRVASIGKIINFNEPIQKFLLSPTLSIIEPNSVNKEFLVNFLKSDLLIKQLKVLSTGSTRSSVGIKLLRELRIIMPSIEEQKKISSILISIEKKINSTKQEKIKNEFLKKSLMQDLLTGKVRVSVN